MKILFKLLATVILNIFLLIFFIVFLDNVGNWIICFLGEIDIRDWWYEFVEYKTINYVLSTALLSGVIFTIWQLVIYCVKSRVSFFGFAIIGEILLVLVNNCYWSYIQKTCFGYEMTFLEEAYIESFGSYKITKKYFILYTCLIFGIGITLNCFKKIVKNNIKKIVAEQIFTNIEIFYDLLCIYLPLLIIITGNHFVVGYMRIPIAWISAIIITIIIFLYIISIFIAYSKTKEYYISAINLSKRDNYYVVVKEAKDAKKSFLYYNLIKNKKNMKRLSDEKIQLLPKSLNISELEDYIVLDIYDEWMIIKSADKQRMAIEEMIHEKGTINIAFCYDSVTVQKIKDVYDKCVFNIDDIFDELVTLKEFLQYRKNQIKNVNKIQTDQILKTNCFIEEISIFKNYIERQLDQFLVFDYAIKWLEIINYMYTIIFFSKQGIDLTTNLRRSIQNADFEKWIKLRNDVESDEIVNTIMNHPYRNECVFQIFNNLWLAVSNKKIQFHDYSIKELLEAANKLRNYTRGHGVFTFEISQEMNLALIEILVFLINQLIGNHLLDEDYSNLEKLGWVIYSGDIPYFLYSINTFQEYCYESFQKGNTITLPIDFRR